MTIQELEQFFDEVYEEQYLDPFQLMMTLGHKKEEYNKSEFAQITGLSIFEAYEFYFKTTLTFKTILRFVQDVVDNIDYTKLNNNLSLDAFFKEVPEEYAIILKDVLGSLNL